MLKLEFPATLAGAGLSSSTRRSGRCGYVWGCCSSSVPLPSPSRNRVWGRVNCPPIRARAAAAPRAVPASDHATTTGEDLRAQLDQLHSEAEAARSKANSARLRLIRLSEAAEQLQRVAASNVKAGKEDDARETLQQKKKIMLALEKSKHRIEVLDKLSAKLNEAISLKEAELIENVVKHSSETEEGRSGPVRIVSPKEDPNEESPEGETYNNKENESDEKNGYQEKSQSFVDVGSARMMDGSDGNNTSISAWMSTYKSFIKHVDMQLESIETDIHAVLRISTAFMKTGDIESYKKLQETREILADITGIRNRILRILETETAEL